MNSNIYLCFFNNLIKFNTSDYSVLFPLKSGFSCWSVLQFIMISTENYFIKIMNCLINSCALIMIQLHGINCLLSYFLKIKLHLVLKTFFLINFAECLSKNNYKCSFVLKLKKYDQNKVNYMTLIMINFYFIESQKWILRRDNEIR